MSFRKTTQWAAGLDIPAGGNTVLYTGLMYQIIPTLTSSEKTMSLMQDSWMGQLFPFGRMVNKFVNLSSFMPPADREEQKRYNQYLRNIVQLLRTAGVKELGYLYENELYAGALVRDLGVDNAFERHAHKVHKMLKKQGVKRIITVDPHTTDMLKNVYPKLVPGYNLEVKSYLKVLSEKGIPPKNRLESAVVIHDSCVYARYLDMIDEPRRLLAKAGLAIRDPEFSGKMTFCCGGPVESLFPVKASEIAGRRIEQLAEAGDDVVTMCPICLHNLEKATQGNGISVKDISELLLQAYAG